MRSIREQIPSDMLSWYAVNCKYRCEKIVARDLQYKGIEAYVPTLKRVKQYASRKKLLESALIPSHVFVKINRDCYLQILQHVHVFKFLNFSGILSRIPEDQMNLMKRIVGESDDVIVEETNYCEGDRVEIVQGELTGIKGVIIDREHHNFKIELSSLGMGLVIYVDPKFLIKMDFANN